MCPVFDLRCLAAVLLVALASTGAAFCGEIHDAAKSGDLEKVKALLNADPALVFSKDQRGRTPLHQAVAHGHKDVTELLLAYKARMEVWDDDGLAPFHVVGSKDVAQLLVSHKADVNVKDKRKGATPLHFAAANGNKVEAEFLLANGAEVNARANDGQTPLHFAADEGYKFLAELLLTSKADVNARDNKGQTPLHQAIIYDHKDVAEFLRQHGGHE